jgi:2-polyprenyl-3-methyl-5-hydroxy-6-metoxy-1,4-benzoquinol methylase
MNCPICDNFGVSTLIKNNYRILKCVGCNHFYTELKISPEAINEIYSNNYFFGGGDGYSEYTLERNSLIKRGEYYANKISRFVKPGNVLDVGAASGFILKGFENLGWKGTGIDPNHSMVEYGRNILGLDIQQGTLEAVDLNLKYDLIIMIQVIAHLFDLNSSMKNVSNFLKSGGYVLIETWNSNSITAKLFGKYWYEFSPQAL